MGATFWIAHWKRKKWTNISVYNFEFSSAKIIILVSITVVAIQTGVISPLVSLVPMPEFMKNIFLEFAQRNGVFSFITIVVAAPILEELIFRGIILDGLLKKYSPLNSIVISSILFGLIHLNPWQFIAAFVIGIFSGWVYYKTKKLTLSILIHFVNNLFAFSFTFFFEPEAVVDMSLLDLYGGFLNLFAVILGATVIALIGLFFIGQEIKNGERSIAVQKAMSTHDEANI
jgi:membrane protease YdiL (CAAX protease family)